jgi:membrane protein implicated in regulation of membrane protease activity
MINEWWDALTVSGRIFWCVALFASLLQVFLFVGLLVGGGSEFDHATDGVDGDHGHSSEAAHGIKVLSVRALVAFGVGFGWAGALALREGWGVVTATVAAVLSGIVFMGLVYAAMRLLFSMRDDGTLDYRNAVGVVGRVYVTVPPRRTSSGQVELMLQGRLITATAVTDAPEPLPPDTQVQVSDVEENTMLVVIPQRLPELALYPKPMS